MKQRVVAASLLAILAVGVGMLAAAGDGGPGPYAPRIDPAAFSTAIDNPYLPLRPGTRGVYEGRTDEGEERKVVEVTDQTRVVMGVPCVVVHDVVTLNGQPFEDTFDWFAEDRDGTVWSFGEASRIRGDDGQFTSAGSWEAGVHGALPGVVMQAHPRPGKPYRQEYLPGEAEDMARVLSVTEALTVPNGSYVEVVVTRDWSPLEAGVADHKHYAPGIGMIREEAVEGETSRLDLIERTRS
ncbi:MAG TPA: hypothetical protein VGP90_05170 [Acidimicrobiia bacterium]|nr:hypothetical protein [Acidimicrobiia bacterium]